MSTETKQCPNCGEHITAAATVCRHCNRQLSKPRSKRRTLMMVLLGSAGAFVLFCCALAGIGSLLEDDTTPEPVVNRLSAATVEPTNEPEPTEAPEQTEAPTDTPEPTPTPTVTDTPVPSAETAITADRYRGPGEAYGKVGPISAGIPVEILAISDNGQWVEVLYRNGTSWLPLASLTNVINLEAVPLAIDVPPPPTAELTNTPRPTNTPRATNTPRPVATQAPPTNTPAPQPTAAPAEADVNIINVNKRDEYADIRNDGGQAQDLSGWNLVSERGNQGCPLYGVIQPGQVIRVYALASDSGLGGINCNHGSNIWNNSEHDPAVLYNAQNQEVDRYP